MPELISEYVPQFVSDEESARRVRRARAAWGATLGVAAWLVALIVAAPLLRAGGWEAAAGGIYKAFGMVCHQIGARSFHVEGFQLAVCARCLGLYVGSLAGAAVYPLARPLVRRDMPGRAWLLAAAVPTTVDFALGFFGVWENTHLSRFLTATLLGAVAAFYVVPGMVDLGLSLRGQLSRAKLQREG